MLRQFLGRALRLGQAREPSGGPENVSLRNHPQLYKNHVYLSRNLHNSAE